MKKQVQGMSPDAIQSAMNMMKNAKPEDIKKQMKEQPMPTDPEEMKRQMHAFNKHTEDQVRAVFPPPNHLYLRHSPC